MHTEALSDVAVVDHYADLAQEYPAMRPMLTLVNRLTRKEYAESVPAGTSHNALVVTWPSAEMAAVSFDPHRQGLQTVSVDPQRHGFHVEYRTRDSRVIRHECGLDEAETLFDCFVLRLSLTCAE